MLVETLNILRSLQMNLPVNANTQPTRALIESMIRDANIREQMFFYQLNLSNLAPGTGAAVQLNIQGDAPFLIQAGMCWAVNEAAQTGITPNTRISPLITLQVSDQGGDGNMSNLPVPIQNLFGVDGVPMVWPMPKLLRANSVLLITPTNYDSALTYDVYLTFIGKKLFGIQQ